MQNILKTLDQFKQPDQININLLLEQLLKDPNFQRHVNSYRKSNCEEIYDFSVLNTPESLIEAGITLDSLLECIQSIRIEEDI